MGIKIESVQDEFDITVLKPKDTFEYEGRYYMVVNVAAIISGGEVKGDFFCVDFGSGFVNVFSSNPKKLSRPFRKVDFIAHEEKV